MILFEEIPGVNKHHLKEFKEKRLALNMFLPIDLIGQIIYESQVFGQTDKGFRYFKVGTETHIYKKYKRAAADIMFRIDGFNEFSNAIQITINGGVLWYDKEERKFLQGVKHVRDLMPLKPTLTRAAKNILK